MFDHGLCVHLIRIALIEEIALPGMMAYIRLVTKQREKAKKFAEKIVESDQEFEENMNLIEMQANTQSQETIQGQTQLQATNAPENIVIAPKKRGRKKKETLPKALEKSLDVAKTQIYKLKQLKNFIK